MKSSRKRGRPKSRLTRDEYTRLKLNAAFDYWVDYAFGMMVDEGKVTREYGSLRWTDDECGFSVDLSDEVQFRVFSDGVRVGSSFLAGLAFRAFLDDAIERFGVSVNLSKMAAKYIARRRAVEERIIHGKVKDDLPLRELESKIDPIPNDSLRQVRRPKESKAEVARFTLAVKQTDGRPSSVSRALGIQISRVWELFEEAKRQKRKITVGNDSKGKTIFLM